MMVFTSCLHVENNRNNTYKANKNNNSHESTVTLDYSDEYNWASIPQELSKKIDVFYVYPTIYADSFPKNMRINNEKARSQAKRMLIVQGGVFIESANIFAPYYRQESMMAKFEFDDSEKSIDESYLLGYRDIEEAFIYYMDYLNNGRPFILVGHSQGTAVLIDLMKSKFDNKELQKKLIAAYIIGYSVTK